MRRLENRVAQLERMASAYTVVMETPEDADRLVEERIKPRWMTPQEWASKPIVEEAFADNGEHSHWFLIDPTTGSKIWSEDPEECSAKGWPVFPSLKDYDAMCAKLEDAEEQAHKAGYDLDCLRAQMERMRLGGKRVFPLLTAEDCRDLYPLGDAYGNQIENGWQDMADRLNRILAGKT